MVEVDSDADKLVEGNSEVDQDKHNYDYFVEVFEVLFADIVGFVEKFVGY